MSTWYAIGRQRLVALEAEALTSAGRYERDGWLVRPLRNLGCLALFSAGLLPRSDPPPLRNDDPPPRDLRSRPALRPGEAPAGERDRRDGGDALLLRDPGGPDPAAGERPSLDALFVMPDHAPSSSGLAAAPSAIGRRGQGQGDLGQRMKRPFQRAAVRARRARRQRHSGPARRAMGRAPFACSASTISSSARRATAASG